MDKSALFRELKRWLQLGPRFLATRRQQFNKDWSTYRNIDETIQRTKKETGSDKVNLLGVSFGGLLSMDYALDNPQDINSIMTVASPYAGTDGVVWSHAMRVFGLYTKTYHEMLRPRSRFILLLGTKLANKWTRLEEEGISITNIISMHDEFVRTEEMSLVDIVGLRPNITEFSVPEGHCEALFNDFTIEYLRKLASEPYPIVAAHPIIYNEAFFSEAIKELDPAQQEKFHFARYDFTQVPDIRYRREDEKNIIPD